MIPSAICADALRSGWLFAAAAIAILFGIIVLQHIRIRYLERKERP